MTRLEDRQALVNCADGAPHAPACTLASIDPATLRCWQTGDSVVFEDRRPGDVGPTPSHALTESERAQIVAVTNQLRFADTPPARIVPALADEGVYIATESSFHRGLRAQGQIDRRGRARPPRASRPPTTHVATAPG